MNEGVNCDTNIDDCAASPCPQAATCIDQVNGHTCHCPFNLTGMNCDKRVSYTATNETTNSSSGISTDYDMHFYDPILPAQAGLGVPFKFTAKALTVSLWVKFVVRAYKGTVFTLYLSAYVPPLCFSRELIH